MKSFIKTNKTFIFLITFEVLILAVMLVRAVTLPRQNLIINASDFSSVDKQNVKTTKEGIGINTILKKKQNTETILSSTLMNLRSGAFKITIDYDAQIDAKIEEDLKRDKRTKKDANGLIEIGTIRLTSKTNPLAIHTSYIPLTPGKKQSSLFWIRFGNRIKDLQLNVTYNGVGSLFIKKIIVLESVLYRFTRCGEILFLFLCLDIIYLLFGENNVFCLKPEQKMIIFCLGLIVFFSSLPFLADFLFIGHDLNFHLSRIAYLADAIREGQIPQRIQFTAKNGFGYAAPLFYGELFLYLPAFLYCIHIPLLTCYQIYAILINLLTCTISYWCFYKMTKYRIIAIIGSCMYIFASYRMTNLLNRAAVGEYTAMVFLPLICYGFWSIYMDLAKTAKLSGYFPLILGLTGLIQSHTLTCLMIIPFIILLLFTCVRKSFSGIRFFILLKSAVITILLNAWFIYPFVVSHINMDLATKHMSLRQGTGIYLIQIFSFFSSFIGSNVNNGMKNEMPLTIGISLTLGLILWLVLCILRQKDDFNQACFAPANFFGICTLLALFCASNFFPAETLANKWSLFKGWYVLRFSWRFLAIATVCGCFMSLSCLRVIYEKNGRNIALKVATALLIPGLLSTGLYMSQFSNAVEERRPYTTPNSSDSIYLIYGTSSASMTDRSALCGNGVKSSDVVYKSGIYSAQCSNDSDSESSITFPVFFYNNYHAYDKTTGEKMNISFGKNNRAKITLPPHYFGTTLLRYEVPISWRICEIASLVMLIILVAYFLILIKARTKTS